MRGRAHRGELAAIAACLPGSADVVTAAALAERVTELARARDDVAAALEATQASAAKNEAEWRARHQALQAELDATNAAAQEAAAVARATLASLETEHAQRERCVLRLAASTVTGSRG